MIQYRISSKKPQAHLFEVSMSFEHKRDDDGVTLRLPTWIPGSYMIRDFSKHIQWLEANCNGQKIPLVALDKSSWCLDLSELNTAEHGENESIITINYQVYAWDLSVRGAHLDQTHGFFNGTSMFLSIDGREDEPCQLEIVEPEHGAINGNAWQVATGLSPIKGTRHFEFGHYHAANYDELIDCPVEMSDFTVIEFTACDVPHAMVLTGKHKADGERLVQDLKLICEHQIRFFGTPAPFERYVFMSYVLGSGFGGLEHRNSTALHCSREDLPLVSERGKPVKDTYQKFLDLCSHEYFHTWNVKRIKPSAFSPYDTTTENYSELLWAFEGITSYYDTLSLVQTGLITEQQYANALAKNLTAVRRAQGRNIQSVTQSSFDAWTKFYKQDENACNSVVSYYTKGALIATCLDALLKHYSNGHASLQTVMQRLWRDYGMTAYSDNSYANNAVGIEKDTIQNICYELCSTDEAKAELAQFFHDALYTTKELPVEQILAKQGVEVHYAHRRSETDRGAYVTKDKKSALLNPVHDLGANFKAAPLGISINSVYLDSAASKAGISAGDCLVAMDGIKLNASDFKQRLNEYEAGQTVNIVGFRRDELMTFTVVIENAAADTAFVSYTDTIEDKNSALSQWLMPNS